MRSAKNEDFFRDRIFSFELMNDAYVIGDIVFTLTCLQMTSPMSAAADWLQQTVITIILFFGSINWLSVQLVN